MLAKPRPGAARAHPVPSGVHITSHPPSAGRQSMRMKLTRWRELPWRALRARPASGAG